MRKLLIEVLAFVGCPNAEQAGVNVQDAIQREGISADVALIEVDTPELAMSNRFLGSPSVRVSGKDVEDDAAARRDYGLMCRTYSDGVALSGAPSVEMIRNAIRQWGSQATTQT